MDFTKTIGRERSASEIRDRTLWSFRRTRKQAGKLLAARASELQEEHTLEDFVTGSAFL